MMEECKGTFEFGVEMTMISFVYDRIGSKFCLWLPASTKNTMEYCMSKSVVYLDYSVCVTGPSMMQDIGGRDLRITFVD